MFTYLYIVSFMNIISLLSNTHSRKYHCRVPIWGAYFTVDVSEPNPNRPNTMNLVEKRA